MGSFFLFVHWTTRCWLRCTCLSMGESAQMQECCLEPFRRQHSKEFVDLNAIWTSLEEKRNDLNWKKKLGTGVCLTFFQLTINLCWRKLSAILDWMFLFTIFEIRNFYLLCNSLKATVLVYQQRCRSYECL